MESQPVDRKIEQNDFFKLRIRKLFQSSSLDCRVIKVPKRGHVYTCGVTDEAVYFIESGQIKMLMLSPDARECMTAIYAAGDFFGEMCLGGQKVRTDTAVALQDTTLRRVSGRSFLARLRQESLLECLVQYLASRITDQQEVIAALLTANSEQRLVRTLLYLGRRFGVNDIRSVRITQKLSHHELAEMVGTTRPRISIFLKKFRLLGLIELSKERQIIIKEKLLTQYLEDLAMEEKPGRRVVNERVGSVSGTFAGAVSGPSILRIAAEGLRNPGWQGVTP